MFYYGKQLYMTIDFVLGVNSESVTENGVFSRQTCLLKICG